MKTKKEILKLSKENKRRALGYALSLVAFQEVGAGEDKFLGDVREIVARIQVLCNKETGIEISGYPIEFIKENIKEIKESYYWTKRFSK